MKRIFTTVCCFVLLFSVCTPVLAAEGETLISSQEIDLGNGIIMVDELVKHTQARATGDTYTRTRTYLHGDTVVAVIAIQATFYHNSAIVYVASKSVTRTDTYDGWSYQQNSFTASGGTVTLDAKLTKLLFLNKEVSISITCDKDGNIT